MRALTARAKGRHGNSKISAHELDAVTCTPIAKAYADGKYLAPGDMGEVLFILWKHLAGILK